MYIYVNEHVYTYIFTLLLTIKHKKISRAGSQDMMMQNVEFTEVASITRHADFNLTKYLMHTSKLNTLYDVNVYIK